MSSRMEHATPIMQMYFSLKQACFDRFFETDTINVNKHSIVIIPTRPPFSASRTQRADCFSTEQEQRFYPDPYLTIRCAQLPRTPDLQPGGRSKQKHNRVLRPIVCIVYVTGSCHNSSQLTHFKFTSGSPLDSNAILTLIVRTTCLSLVFRSLFLTCVPLTVYFVYKCKFQQW